jgi:hypothetical protein
VIATTQTPLTGCDTDDGIITVTGGGSTGVVNWSGPVSGNSGSVSLPYDITGLEPGTYDVTFYRRCYRLYISCSSRRLL